MGLINMILIKETCFTYLLEIFILRGYSNLITLLFKLYSIESFQNIWINNSFGIEILTRLYQCEHVLMKHQLPQKHTSPNF